MVAEAAGDKLGRLIGRARKTAGNVSGPAWLDRSASADVEEQEPAVEINIELEDALARADAAEARVAQLTAELAHKDEILAEAKRALRTARLALGDHLRLTEP